MRDSIVHRIIRDNRQQSVGRRIPAGAQTGNCHNSNYRDGEIPMLILICGGSCAGKSRFALRLKKSLSEAAPVVILSTDMFYTEIPPHTNLREHNFDTPGSVDIAYMIECCAKILSRQSVDIHTFEFKTHSRSGSMHVPVCDVLILEGIFAFYSEEIRNLASLRIFIDTGEQVRHQRRYQHYSQKLGQSDEFIEFKIRTQEKPLFDSVIMPSKNEADLIISGERPFDKAIKCVRAFISAELS